MVGAMYAINYAKEYGIEPTPALLPSRIDTFHVNRNLHFRQVSEVIGTGNQGDYILRLPFHYSGDFLDQQDRIYAYKADEVFKQVDVEQSGAAGFRAASSSGGTKTEWVYYTVRSGDSLGKIASRNHVTVKQLQSWNKLRGTTIRAGQRLKVKQKTVSTASSGSKGNSSASAASSGSYTVYTVRSGDTLYKIAKRYGVSTNQIMKLNSIGEEIRPGMKLKIPKA